MTRDAGLFLQFMQHTDKTVQPHIPAREVPRSTLGMVTNCPRLNFYGFLQPFLCKLDLYFHPIKLHATKSQLRKQDLETNKPT
jgi:hypothetical protein